MAGSISTATSRAIYDDALRAFNDQQHPCHTFRYLQVEGDGTKKAEWQLPEPFNGASANAGVVFLGLNPSYGGAEKVPSLGTSFEEWDGFYRRRFESDQSNWALLYRRYQHLGEMAVGVSFRLGQDALVLEVVRFRSAGGAGVDTAVLDQERPLTRRLLGDVQPRVIVSVGTWVLWELRSLFPDLKVHVAANYRLRDLIGEVLDVPWPEGDGSVRILVCPHLTGSFGLSNSTLTWLGERLHHALNAP